MTATVERSTVLDADADRVWLAMCHPASFLYVCRGPLGRVRYSDRIVIDAGGATRVAAAMASAIYAYRQRRWQRLARRHLSDRSTLPAGS